MAKRIVALLALALVSSCGLDFDRYSPATDSRGDATPDVTPSTDAPGEDDADTDAMSRPEAGSSDATSDGDAVAADGPACGGNGEHCCSGRTCQGGLMCKGPTCRP